MQAENEFAFKEWAAVCAAHATGRQSIIIRKGGIHEGRGGFRVEHDEFWLFPTYLHEAEQGVVDDAQFLLAQANSDRPPDGTLAIRLYAAVSDVVEIRHEWQLAKLAGQHIWSHDSLAKRFHYRRPGVFLLVVRIYARQRPIVIPDSPHFAGCRSWVEFPKALATEGLAPVLDDDAFTSRRKAVLDSLAQHA